MSLTAKLLLSPMLVAQATLTRLRQPRLPEPDGAREGVAQPPPVARSTAKKHAGDRTPATTVLRLLVVGDSSAAGVGVAHQAQALAPQLARCVAEQTGAVVHWQLLAQSGLTTAQATDMLHGATHTAADLVVVLTGVNDVVDQVPSAQAVQARDTLANRLRNAKGVQHVVFAPLPPVHQFPALPQPLRWVAGADAQRHNRALASWAGTRTDVSCVDMSMPLNRGVMAADGFHPGEPVYRYCAGAIAEHIATQVWPGLRLV
jgi:lysophospholipase L1-like esterase